MRARRANLPRRSSYLNTSFEGPPALAGPLITFLYTGIDDYTVPDLLVGDDRLLVVSVTDHC